MAPLEPGTVAADYTIESVLGRGGMGVVYRATQRRLNRTVALKVISPDLAADPVFRARFERESRLAASIEHPHVLPVYEEGELGDGTPFISMRFVDGIDLGSLIELEGRLGATRTVRIVEQIAGALDAAHARGLIHRDVKPTNILVAIEKGSEHAYLTDFGIARDSSLPETITQPGQLVGTPPYMAPEQIEGRPVDARADVYSLGCVLYAALTGRTPREASGNGGLAWTLTGKPPVPPTTLAPGLPSSFDRVVNRALALDPGDRYASAGELGQAAGEALWGHERQAQAHAQSREPDAVNESDSASPPRRRPGRKLSLGLLVGAVWALAIVVALTTRVFSGSNEEVRASAGLLTSKHLTTGSFGLEVPAGWLVKLKESPQGDPPGSFLRTELVSLGGGESLVLDRTLGATDPLRRFAAVLRRGLAGEDGYREIRFAPETINGRRVYLWEFEEPDPGEGGTVRKTDRFLVAGGDTYGILTTAEADRTGDVRDASAADRRAAATIEPR